MWDELVSLNMVEIRQNGEEKILTVLCYVGEHVYSILFKKLIIYQVCKDYLPRLK